MWRPAETMSLPSSLPTYQGALVGVAIGDALGAPFEGDIPYEPYLLDGLFGEIEALPYTDDTHMTIGMVESLLECGEFDGEHMASIFAVNLAKESWRGYAAGPPEVLFSIASGVPWGQASRTPFGGAGSYGNGGAMRVAPAALVSSDLDEVAVLARRTALITHAHELGIEGAVLQACSVALALDSEEIDVGRFMAALAKYAFTDVYKDKLEKVGNLLSAGEDVGGDQVVDQLGNGVQAYESVPTAIYSFLRHPNSFKDAILFALELGGDCDTIASMTGAASGAYLGVDAIPLQWVDGVEGVSRMRELAGAMSQKFRPEGRPA